MRLLMIAALDLSRLSFCPLFSRAAVTTASSNCSRTRCRLRDFKTISRTCPLCTR